MNNDDDDRDEDDDDLDDDGGDGSGYREVEIREQDRFLPIANIARIMKKVLPPNAKIAKDAKESIQECVSEFISFITSEASDKCLAEKRKTINGDDLLWAMNTLGFDKYVEPLKIYLAKYRESVKGEKPEKVKSSLTGRKDVQAQPKSLMMPPPPMSMMMSGAGGAVHGMVLPSPSMLGQSNLLGSGVSDFSSFSPYDNSSGSLLGGALADQSLFLAPGKLDSRLPPIPKSSAIPHTHIALSGSGSSSSSMSTSSVVAAAHAHAPMPAPHPAAAEEMAARRRAQALQQQQQQSQAALAQQGNRKVGVSTVASTVASSPTQPAGVSAAAQRK